MNVFGYSSSGINTLKSYYATALRYAQATDDSGAVPISVVGIVQNLNFSNGTGAQLVAQQISWEAYVSQLDGAVQGIIDARTGSGMDASDVIDWWANIAMPQLSTLSLTERAENIVAPTGSALGEDVGSIFDKIPLWVKLGGGGLLVVIILGQLSPALSLLKWFAPKKQRRATAGYRRRR
jgi:hypothetical protein